PLLLSCLLALTFSYTLSLHDALPIYAVLGINSLMFGFEVHTALYFGLCAILLGYCRETPVREATRPVPDLPPGWTARIVAGLFIDRKSTRLNSSHVKISYAVFCLKKK